MQEVNFLKYFWGCCAPDGLYLCIHIAVRQMAPQWTTKFRTARFRQFLSNLRKEDSVANYWSISKQFPPSVRGLDVRYNALHVS